jgi:hypothetical protein
MRRTHREASRYAVSPSLRLPQLSPSAPYSRTPPSPFSSFSLTDNLAYLHQTSDSSAVLCVLGSRQHINNTLCGCYGRRHIYFPLPSKELCLSPIYCLLPHISEHKLITCHLAQQINYFQSPPRYCFHLPLSTRQVTLLMRRVNIVFR